MKQNMLVKNIRTVFRMSEKYFGDAVSTKVSKELEAFFESEFAIAPLVVDGVNENNFFYPDQDGQPPEEEEDDEEEDRRSKRKKKKDKKDKSEREKSRADAKEKKKTHKKR